MGFKLRKLFVWFICLGAVLAVYLLVMRANKTPQISMDVRVESPNSVGQFGDKIGMIGDVGVGKVQKARFVRSDREFGFDKLLHKEGDQWELEKPYMTIFRPNFDCYITSDKGSFVVENTLGEPSPKDATFSGNVVIHIVPKKSGSIQESFIYLDDVVFISEKSQFSTAGPVKFVSENIQMLGRGLELIYNAELGRLEFLRIPQLQSLKIKSDAALFSKAPAAHEQPGGQPDNALTVNPQTAGDKKYESYKVVFSRDVVIDAPEQLIFADDVFINNIPFSKASGEKTDKPVSGTGDVNERGKVIEEADTSEQNVAKELTKKPADIVVTCDNGIIVAPTDSVRMERVLAEFESEGAAAGGKEAKKPDYTDGRAVLAARRIDYYATGDQTVAGGPLKLRFYVNDVMASGDSNSAVPVDVTAKEKAEFLPLSNQVVFVGDCLSTMIRDDPNGQQKYTLWSPKLTVNLSKDKTVIEHLTANGGVVKLAVVKTAKQSPQTAQQSQNKNILSGIELKCDSFDYDAEKVEFLAAGPGLIKIVNSNAAEAANAANRFSLQNPCWALVKNFQMLRYLVESKQIIADANSLPGSDPIFVDYVPLNDGQKNQRASATGRHIEINLVDKSDGRTEISTLTATGGVTYENEDNQFSGSKLFYDADKAIIMVQGDESEPAYFNGVVVKGIVFDIKTGKVKFEIVGPGAFEMK